MGKDSSDVNVDNIIGDLCDDLSPVKKRCPYRNIAIWGVLALAYIVGIILYYGPSIDLSEKVTNASFIFEVTMALAIFGFGALSASFLSFPDEMQLSWVRHVTVTLFAVFMLWIFANIVEEGFNLSAFTLGSCYRGIFVEALPFAALIFLTIRGHSTKPYWLMAMHVFAVSAIGWIGLRITCAMYDSMVYSFIHYLLPFIALSVVIGFFSRKIFKW